MVAVCSGGVGAAPTQAVGKYRNKRHQLQQESDDKSEHMMCSATEWCSGGSAVQRKHRKKSAPATLLTSDEADKADIVTINNSIKKSAVNSKQHRQEQRNKPAEVARTKAKQKLENAKDGRQGTSERAARTVSFLDSTNAAEKKSKRVAADECYGSSISSDREDTLDQLVDFAVTKQETPSHVKADGEYSSSNTTDAVATSAAAAPAAVIVERGEGVFDTSCTFDAFGALHFDRRLTRVVTQQLHLQYPTRVQMRVIPLALQGKDLLVQASTGSGKTLAYVLPLLQRVLQQRHCDSSSISPSAAGNPGNSGGGGAAGGGAIEGIILVPSKELAIQVYSVVAKLLKYMHDNITVAHTAHLSVDAAHTQLPFLPPSVLVGTPAGVLRYLRILQKLQGQLLMLRETLLTLVLDEADLLLSYGYEEEFKQLLLLLPSVAERHYQALLLSATLNDEVSQLQSLLLHKPTVVRVSQGSSRNSSSNPTVSEFYLLLPRECDRWLAIYALLKLSLLPGKTLIFAKGVHSAYSLRLFLERFGLSCGLLSPILPIASRQTVIQAFNEGVIPTLIGTDGAWEDANEEARSSQCSNRGAATAVTAFRKRSSVESTACENFERQLSSGSDANDADDSDDSTSISSTCSRRSSGSSKPNSLCDGEDIPAAAEAVERAAKESADNDEKTVEGKAGKKKKATPFTLDSESAAHRGLDLQGLACVINFDMPPSLRTYIHRIGRAGRGGSAGVALTFVVEDSPAGNDMRMLQKLLAARGSHSTEESLLNMTWTKVATAGALQRLQWQMQSIESFRYRVEDIQKSITKRVVAAAVARDLQREVLLSRRMHEFFKRHPCDEEILRAACRQLRERSVGQAHLKHLPDYLLVSAQESQKTAVQLAIEKQQAEEKQLGGNSAWGARGSRFRKGRLLDPLRTFSAGSIRQQRGSRKRQQRVYTREEQLLREPDHTVTAPEQLPALSRRKLWKLKHGKKLPTYQMKGNFLRRQKGKKRRQ